MPSTHAIDVIDANRRHYTLTATTISGCPWNAWSNAEMDVCLARWECDGRTGDGDSQLAVWTDFSQLVD